jgi:hypothetical protein
MAAMSRHLLGAATAAALLLCLSCSGGEPAAPTSPGAPAASPEAAAEAVATLIRDRKFGEIYDDASPEFQSANARDEVVEGLGAVSSFGRLLDWKAGDARRASAGDAELVSVPLDARFALGEGTIELTFRGRDGKWRLDHYGYDVGATTYDPPYPATEDGADKLAHRFMFLWQNRRYDDLARIMPISEDAGEVREFLARLEPAGDFLTLKRASFGSFRRAGALGATADFNLRFEHGRGFVVFTLLERDEQWTIDKIKYDVEYQTDDGSTADDEN